jgi:hypothetical protein
MRCSSRARTISRTRLYGRVSAHDAGASIAGQAARARGRALRTAWNTTLAETRIEKSVQSERRPDER